MQDTKRMFYLEYGRALPECGWTNPELRVIIKKYGGIISGY